MWNTWFLGKQNVKSLLFLKEILKEEDLSIYENETILILVEFLYKEYKKVLFTA